MEVHRLVTANHAAEPWATVETYRQFAGFFQMGFDAPLLKLAQHPFGGIFVSVRADETSAEAVAQDVEVMHGLVVCLGRLDDFLDGSRLCEGLAHAHGCSYEGCHK